MSAMRKSPRDLGSPGTGCTGLFTSEGSLFVFGVCKSNDEPPRLEIVRSVEMMDSEINSVAWNHCCANTSHSSHLTQDINQHNNNNNTPHPFECIALCGDSTPVCLVDPWASGKAMRIEPNDIDRHTSKQHRFANVVKSQAMKQASLLRTNREWLATSHCDSLSLTRWSTGLTDYHFQGKHTITAMDLIADRYLVSADIKGDIVIHNCKSGMVASKLSDYSYQSCVNDMDGCLSKLNWFGVSNDSGHVYVFDLSRDSMVYDSGAHTTAAHSCAFNPIRSSWLLSAGMDCNVYLHDVSHSKISAKIKCSAPLTCVDWMPNTNSYQIMTASIDGSLCCYDLRSTREPWLKHSNDTVIFNLTLHPSLDWSHLYDKLSESAQSVDVLSKWRSGVLSEGFKGDPMQVDTPAEPTIPSAVHPSKPEERKPLTRHLLRTADRTTTSVSSVSPPSLSDTTEVHSVPVRSNTQQQNAQMTGVSAREIRDIIREEILASEQRVYRKMDEMLSSLHADLITQLCSSDERMESGLSALTLTVKDWKQTLDGNEQRLFDL